jgi:hypothetical protein
MKAVIDYAPFAREKRLKDVSQDGGGLEVRDPGA